jgi:AcrR family transcriptional regulator
MVRGRPRLFDPDTALDRAIEVFWRQGYEGTTMADLTTAMGMNKPSIYATFGSKEELFRKAIQRYAAIDMEYARAALDEPTARDVVRKFLTTNAQSVTQPGRPSGCLSIQGGTACGHQNESVVQFLATSRLAGEAALANRFRAAVAAGDLPPDAQPTALARFVMAYSEGQAVHAAAGATRNQLLASARIAILGFEAAAYRMVDERPA